MTVFGLLQRFFVAWLHRSKWWLMTVMLVMVAFARGGWIPWGRAFWQLPEVPGHLENWGYPRVRAMYGRLVGTVHRDITVHGYVLKRQVRYVASTASKLKLTTCFQ